VLTFSTFNALICSMSSDTLSSLSCSLPFCRSLYFFCASLFFSFSLPGEAQTVVTRCGMQTFIGVSEAKSTRAKYALHRPAQNFDKTHGRAAGLVRAVR